jgi:hypothetical protein
MVFLAEFAARFAAIKRPVREIFRIPFMIEASTSSGPVSYECTTAADTMAKVLQSEKRRTEPPPSKTTVVE